MERDISTIYRLADTGTDKFERQSRIADKVLAFINSILYDISLSHIVRYSLTSRDDFMTIRI